MFEEFSPVSKKEWQEKVIKDLKGRAFEELQWHLEQDIVLDPFYHSDDSITQNLVYTRASSSWEVGEEIVIQDPPESNKQLLHALKNGVDSPCLVFNSLPEVQDFSIILKNIIPSYIKLNLKLDREVEAWVQLLKNYSTYLQSNQIETASLEGGLYFKSNNGEDYKSILELSKKYFPKYRCINISSTSNELGSSGVVRYLSDLTKSIDQTFQSIEEAGIPAIQVSLNLGKSFFIEIAKIRAIRILWEQLCKAYQVPNKALFINAHFDEATYDDNTNTNMIRSMTIAMSAVIGGVDRLTIRPTDISGSSMTNRIARNVQHLLKMESYMDRVVDPAAGSYYIEKLTNLFVEKAWENFAAS